MEKDVKWDFETMVSNRLVRDADGNLEVGDVRPDGTETIDYYDTPVTKYWWQQRDDLSVQEIQDMEATNGESYVANVHLNFGGTHNGVDASWFNPDAMNKDEWSDQAWGAEGGLESGEGEPTLGKKIKKRKKPAYYPDVTMRGSNPWANNDPMAYYNTLQKANVGQLQEESFEKGSKGSDCAKQVNLKMVGCWAFTASVMTVGIMGCGPPFVEKNGLDTCEALSNAQYADRVNDLYHKLIDNNCGRSQPWFKDQDGGLYLKSLVRQQVSYAYDGVVCDYQWIETTIVDPKEIAKWVNGCANNCYVQGSDEQNWWNQPEGQGDRWYEDDFYWDILVPTEEELKKCRDFCLDYQNTHEKYVSPSERSWLDTTAWKLNTNDALINLYTTQRKTRGSYGMFQQQKDQVTSFIHNKGRSYTHGALGLGVPKKGIAPNHWVPFILNNNVIRIWDSNRGFGTNEDTDEQYNVQNDKDMVKFTEKNPVRFIMMCGKFF